MFPDRSRSSNPRTASIRNTRSCLSRASSLFTPPNMQARAGSSTALHGGENFSVGSALRTPAVLP